MSFTAWVREGRRRLGCFATMQLVAFSKLPALHMDPAVKLLFNPSSGAS